MDPINYHAVYADLTERVVLDCSNKVFLIYSRDANDFFIIIFLFQ